MSSAFSEHEYEPIGKPSGILATTMNTVKKNSSNSLAPVVRINETDVVNVAYSDEESIDINERRYTTKFILDGDVVVPLDGEIEDNAMQARELGGTGDTSEDQETAQQLQDRLEERFLNTANSFTDNIVHPNAATNTASITANTTNVITPCNESRTDAEINTSQVDSSAALEEQKLQFGARGFPERLRSQAGKLRSRLRGIQRPKFSLPERKNKTDNTKTTKVIDKSKTIKPVKKNTEKSRFSLPERPKFNFPDRPKFNLPDRAKFSMPERPKFNLPERPKFNIKRPNINLPTLGRVKKPLKERQHSGESTSSSKRNIFDFSTYPRLFDKKSKSRGEYATSSPKPSRAQSPESATVPRAKKKTPIGARWVQHFSDIKYADDEPESAVERSRPWRHPSIEEPQVAFRPETMESRERLPWEGSDDRSADEKIPDDIEDENKNMEYNEEDSVDVENRRIIVQLPLGHEELIENPSVGLDERITDGISDPRLYPRGLEGDSFDEEGPGEMVKENWRQDSNENEERRDEIEQIRHPDSYGNEEYSGEMIEDGYGGDFLPIDPPRRNPIRETTPDETSMRSDREQQSSGSSSDRRRRGVLEEIDSDEFFLRAKGISQDDMNVGRFLASEIRDAFRPTGNALADQELDIVPPTRPVRTRSLRKNRRIDENPAQSYDALPPTRPKRDRRRSEDSMRIDDYENNYNLPAEKSGSISGSRHRVIYQAEEIHPAVEPLDDIVVVKPARRKSRSVARSYSEFGSDVLHPVPTPPTPPVAPRRRKRGRRDADLNGGYINGQASNNQICNGHRQDLDWVEEMNFLAETHEEPEIFNREQLQNFVNRLDHEYIEPAPMAPKRRSRSRGTSVADDDRTSRGAESLPEMSYVEEDVATAGETDSRDPPGYAVVDKREKPPRPPPPRRRRDKFATAPRTPAAPENPAVPVRPRRAYSTLGPSRRRSTSEDRSVNQMDVTPYTELDSDDPDSRDLQSGPVLNKIQGRPLPAPPRPPRARRDAHEPTSSASNGVVEVAASTQTDPLPDDVVIEEEVTRAKLVMAPSRSGSQILVSTERIATPTSEKTLPVVPPLPQSVRSSERFVEPSDEAEEVEEEEEEEIIETHRGEPEIPEARPLTPISPAISLPLPQEERIRIASLEVADLRVERLNVSQLEAHKISASEVDAVVVSASEISNTSNPTDAGIHPSLLRELIAIRSHLEQVAIARQGRETPLEIVQSEVADKKNEEQPPSAVNDLIEALKRSDRSEERDEIKEESENIETQTIETSQTELTEQLKSETEEQSVKEPVHDEEMKKTNEEIKKLNSDVKTDDGEIKVEEIHDSKPLQNFDSSLTPSKIQETPKAHVPASLSTPAIPQILRTNKEEDRVQSQPSKIDEIKEDKRKSSRSRSASPIDGIKAVRQTASPVKSLPPLISVTPDTPDPVPSPIPEDHIQPQRATVSYTQSIEEEVSHRQPTVGAAQFVAFPTSQIPAEFFSLASPTSLRLESEPSITEMTQQLMRAVRLAGTRTVRRCIGYMVSRVSVEDRGEKTKEIELALCALMLLIVGLLILCFGSPRTVTHHHHWDYFNPPQ